MGVRHVACVAGEPPVPKSQHGEKERIANFSTFPRRSSSLGRGSTQASGLLDRCNSIHPDEGCVVSPA
ncbi:hypothetical protein DB31_3583 [Hyalangium minutum]|uniref:Uncharacterized protein n=1 Tax=Hyalangium minutum TaxID=394096 RepID=A0A085WUU0_9BACT|nr:hypothetical protein DB31_3583 [Hyalangium minutum]